MKIVRPACNETAVNTAPRRQSRSALRAAVWSLSIAVGAIRAFFLLLGTPEGACSGVFIAENAHRYGCSGLHLQGKCSSLPLMAQVELKELHSTEATDLKRAASTRLAFEVATVKPSASDSPPRVNFTLGAGDVYANTGGRLIASNITLLDYIRFAYKLTDGQVGILRASAPNWIATQQFDIQAKSEMSNPSKDQMRLMMQALLEERFELNIHSETRELPVLALVLAKPGRLGPQLRPHPLEDKTCSNVLPALDEDSGPRQALEVPAVCGGLVSMGVPNAPRHVRLGGRKISLALLAAHLGEMGQYDRPIVDQTGLTGTFDLVLEWGADTPALTGFSDQDNGQSLLQEALKNQLGLKLERKRALSTVFLIDHLNQRPKEN